MAGATGVAQVFDLHALKAFAPDKRVRKMLFKTEQLYAGGSFTEKGLLLVLDYDRDKRWVRTFLVDPDKFLARLEVKAQ